VPREYFEMFPIDSIELPALLENDLDDVPPRGVELAHRGGNYHEHVLAADQWREAVQGYLASIAYADMLVGRLLDALDASPHADDTIVILWSDHGWQLGEKEHWRKFALWENLARVVFMVKAPAGTPGLPQGTPSGARSRRTVSLLDIFPTLVSLTGIPMKAGLDGRDLTPLLADPEAGWDRPVITTFGYGEYSIRNERYRYIRYIDGGEELYDHQADPEEWTNLAGDPEYASIVALMSGYVPADPAPFVDTSYELAPHHIPPIRSLEDYLSRKR
jgi:arylsulfatase A-like enzyme